MRNIIECGRRLRIGIKALRSAFLDRERDSILMFDSHMIKIRSAETLAEMAATFSKVPCIEDNTIRRDRLVR
jgi:hypothetical protein